MPETDVPHVRYASGRFVFDEVFLRGRLVGRYWSSTGVIRPEMHFRWSEWYTQVAPLLPVDAFSLAMEGQTLSRDWEWLGVEETPDPSGFRGEGRPVRHVVVHLARRDRPLALDVHTRLDGSLFVLRWLEITNLGDKATAISAVFPWCGLIWNHRYSEGTLDGAVTPFEVAYTHHFEPGEEGDIWFESVLPGTRVVDGGRQGRSGWGRPAFVLHNRANGETLWGELGWSGNWRMEFTCLQDRRRSEVGITFGIGPDAPDPALRVLDPGERVSTPVVHLALFHADIDACVQAAHDHVRHVVMPAQLPGLNQRVEANHRGYICDRESEDGLEREIDIAAAVGAEVFIVDAGWFGPDPNIWHRNVGDWHAGSWLPNGLEPVREHARKRGLLFGLWMEIESIGLHARLRAEHPDWVLTRDGEPVGKGFGAARALDLSRPEVVEWMESQITGIISRYDLDLFRIDYNTTVFEGGNRVYQGFVENTLWRHCANLYGILARVRARFPNVIFENCAAGGGRLDWEILRRFHVTEISDWMRAPRGLFILNGITFSLPPEVCLRTFGTEVGEHVLDGDLDFQLRVAILCHPTLRGISPNLEQLNPHLRERVAHALDLYKSFVRPLLPTSRVYHHTGFLPLYQPAPWCVLEYAAPDKTQAVIGVFRTADGPDSVITVRPRGLDRGRVYRVYLDNSAEVVTMPGHELANAGVRIVLPCNLTSELLLLEVPPSGS